MASEEVHGLHVAPASNKPLPSTTTHSMPLERHTIIINVAEIPRSLFARDGDWTESPITALLGVPLKVVGCPGDLTYNGCTGFSYAVQILFICLDVGSSDFALMNRGPISGAVLIAHCDEVDFDHDRTYFVLTGYINEFFVKHGIAELPDGQEKEDVKRKAMMKMSKEAFHAHFEEFLRLETYRGRGKEWKGMKSPVLIKYPDVRSACGLCGKTGGELSACGKCKVRFCCSRDCQKEDWKMHKRACGIRIEG